MGRLILPGILALATMVQPATAAVLRTGAGQAYATLGDAVRAARDGDTIHLVAGSYFECASISRRNLVLEGEGSATILTDLPCEGKASLVLHGDGATVRDLVLARIRVPDHNGAGIRLEAQGLTIERVTFENDEVGVLAGQAGSGTITVRDCVFRDGGVAVERPTSALSVAAVALLRVERSSFEGFRGIQVTTAAVRTELVGNTMGAGDEAVVAANGPMLVMRDNAITLGPRPVPRGAAIVASGSAVTLESNRLHNGTGQPAVLLLDWTDGTPALSGNLVEPGDTVVSSEGSLRHRAGLAARGLAGSVRGTLGDAKQAARHLLGR